jgi:hypothetical protein
MTGMPRSVVPCLVVLRVRSMVRSRLTSFSVTFARLVCRPYASPSQLFIFASLIRALRLWMISTSRGLWVGETRSMGHLTQLCSCWQLDPYGLPQSPSATLRSWKCC